MARRVLVTGARGMLGQALAASCPADVELVASDVPGPDGQPGTLVVGGEGPHGRPAVEQDVLPLDITDGAAVAAVLEAQAPEAVINAAAFTAVDLCESRYADALLVNGVGPGRLAEACAARGAALLHVSTDFVFAGDIGPGRTYAVDDAPAPVSAYGFTKWAGERAVAATCPRHWIVRTQWLFGLGGPNFVETMLRLGGEVASGQRESLGVVADQYGSPTSTHCLAPWLWGLLERDAAPGLYHGANRGETSWHGFASAAWAGAGLDVTAAEIAAADYSRAARTPDRSTLDASRLAAALDLEIPTWQEALDDYLARRAAAQPESTP